MATAGLNSTNGYMNPSKLALRLVKISIKFYRLLICSDFDFLLCETVNGATFCHSSLLYLSIVEPVSVIFSSFYDVFVT